MAGTATSREAERELIALVVSLASGLGSQIDYWIPD